MPSIKIYSKDYCPYCTAAKDFFTTLNLQYEEIDIMEEKNREEHMTLVEKYNHRTVPMIFINDTFIGGYSDLMELQKAGKLQEMLV